MTTILNQALKLEKNVLRCGYLIESALTFLATTVVEFQQIKTMIVHLTDLLAEFTMDEDEELEQCLDSFLSHIVPLFDFFSHNTVLRKQVEETILALFDRLTSGTGKSKLFNKMTKYAQEKAF